MPLSHKVPGFHRGSCIVFALRLLVFVLHFYINSTNYIIFMFTPAFLVAFTPDIIICYGLLGFIGLIVLLNYYPHLNGKGFS